MSRYVKTVNFIKNLVSGSKTSPTISSVTLSKNLAKRRGDQDSIVAGVDKHLKSSDTASSKIKKKFTKQASSIHDKYEKKADGGRMGYKDGTKSGVGRDHGGTNLKLKNKKFFILGDSKKDQKKYYDMSRAGARDMNKTGQGKKFRDATTVDKETGQIRIKRDEKKAMGGRIGRKMGGGSDMSNTAVKKKNKGFSKLPESIQIKINKKLAKKV